MVPISLRCLLPNIYISPAFLGGFIAAAIWKAEAKVVAHRMG